MAVQLMPPNYCLSYPGKCSDDNWLPSPVTFCYRLFTLKVLLSCIMMKIVNIFIMAIDFLEIINLIKLLYIPSSFLNQKYLQIQII